MYQPTHVVTSEKEIRSVPPEQYVSQVGKGIDHIDDFCRVWIERSPFISVSTVSQAGCIDVSPKGDPPGFVNVLDNKTLAIPDRPGNNRFNSFINIIETGRIGIIFLVPTRREFLRVSGSAQVVRDQDLRESMAINERIPAFAILVRVEEAFFHCGKSLIRSGMWQPDSWVDLSDLPSYGQALKAHGDLVESVECLEELTRISYAEKLY